jgi:UrcA family protein
VFHATLPACPSQEIDMQRMAMLAALSLGACATLPPPAPEPHVTVEITDLTLTTVSGRAVLRQRVAAAAHQFCRLHGAEITPIESREDPWYCPDMMRSEIMYRMTPSTRRAYAIARREAGLRGRDL